MEHRVFEWVAHIPGLSLLPSHVANSILLSVVLIIVVLLGYSQLKKTEDDVVPASKMTFRNFVEIVVEAIYSFVEENMGRRTADFLPIIGTLALFILINNLSGLIPGFLPATQNVNTTFACSITVFVLTHYYGLKEHGIKYLKHFAGPVWWLAWLMIPIEVISHFARPLSLGLRLFGNMMGDHLVVGLFASLVPLFLPVPIMFLGLFVALVQTFVFSLLSMVYFSGAIEHEEEA
jgi:F-type H+-transporting ATPase subunit a